jgi:phenylacetate-coenzyme A ligase PaaK-like adenylate-forming protein
MGATTMAEVGMKTPVTARQYFQREFETMPREQLAALQLERLRATVRNAYERVPLHRARLTAAGCAPGDIASLADVARLPFTQKADLRDHYPFGLFARPLGELARLHASSGTTGKPTVVGYTRNDIDTWSDLMARSLATAGARRGDVVHNAYGYGLFTGGLGAHYGAERLGAVVVPMSGGSTERQIALIVDFGARVLCECDCQAGLHGWEDHFLFEVRGVNVYPSQIEAVLVGLPGIAPHYQLIVERRGSLDHVSVEAEAQPGVDTAAYDAIAHQVAHHIKSLVGITTDVLVKKPGEIPRSQGKAVRVRDLRKKGA